jgi:hypothetical protein
MYPESVLGGHDFVWYDIVVGSGVDGREEDMGVGDGNGEVGIGRRISGVSASAAWERDVSYAMVVSTNWRNMIRKSSVRSCIFDGM